VSDAVFAEAVVARRARIAHCRTEQGSWPIQCNSTVWSIPLTSKRRRRSGRAAGRLTSLAALCVLPVCVAAIIAVGSLDAPPQSASAKTNGGNTPAALAGFATVDRQLGDKAPTGRGIAVLQVEGNAGDYVPNVRDTAFEGVTFTPRSGESRTNGHAQAVGRVLYGPRGLAPGVEQVHNMTTSDWIGDGLLNAHRPKPPAEDPARVQTHSWIMPRGSSDVLRRVDYLADARDVIVVAGVNNNKTPVPMIVASSYNGIAVGHWSGNSSGGYTKYEGKGRCKPDLVAPGGLTSFATPAVAAAAARLLEQADRMADDEPDAGRSEVIKATLLAGADKPKGWEQAEGKPLDAHLGAGRLRFDRSFEILRSGSTRPGKIRAMTGWDFRSLKHDHTASYRLQTPRDLGELSLILTFHRRIDGRYYTDTRSGRERCDTTPRLADFDLVLYRLDNEGRESVAAKSVSEIDNTEHIYLPKLPAGRYRIKVSRKDDREEAWEYAVAWRLEAGE